MISIVIPSWNGRHLLEKSIPSLLSQMDDDWEIIVVDNGSNDGTVEWLRKSHPSVKFIALQDNHGFSGGVNHGIISAGLNDVLLVNNDTEASIGYLFALKQAILSKSNVHIFASRVVHSAAPHLIDTVGDGFTIAGFGYKIGWMQPDGLEFDSPREVFAASGCSVLIRRVVFETIGLFDEDFFAFGEDLDFCFRARLAGFQVAYVPEAKIYHDVRATATSSNTLLWYHRNLIWLLVKNLPGPLWLLYAPHIISHAILVFLRSIFGRWFGTYCHSWVKAVRGFRRMFIKRRQIQALRTVPLTKLRAVLEANWIGVHLRLHRDAKNVSRQKNR